MRTLVIFILAGLLSACANRGEDESTENLNIPSETKEGIELSAEQKERAGIETAKIEQQTIADVVFCTGKLSALPQNKANVSPVIGGFIQKINYHPGEKVKQGMVLAKLQHSNFFDLQQQYVETKARKDYYSEEYKRQGELTVENAASMKSLQQAKADFYSSEAKYKSLKAQLKMLGVDVAQIEQGDFVPSFAVTAPVSGIITSIHGNTGMYIDPGTSIFEIVNDKQLYLVLSVLEKDLNKITFGQKITFQPLNSDKIFETKVNRIGNKINAKERMVPIFATIDNTGQQLKTGMFIEAQILTDEKKIYALPEEAIFENKEETMVFVEKNNQYLKILVHTGLTKDGWREIIDPDPQLLGQPVVIKGGYYLQSVLEIME
ncbi:MAG TPA: efflux RND transporter periplasmic adaptor subunit [Bacteroidales bacterium]|nr:efflux RND transporter periplasmic adaptor subunit [Bacteroidales bacterium]